MLNYDFSPFYRSTVGFDRLLTLLDKASGADNGQSYPPYNIERTGENNYRITLAVAGFAENELSVEIQGRRADDSRRQGSAPKADAEKREMLYQGIAARAFERRFHLADHVSAVKADGRERSACTSTSCAKCRRRRSRAAFRSRPLRPRRSTSRGQAGRVMAARAPEGAPQGRLFRCAAAARRDVQRN